MSHHLGLAAASYVLVGPAILIGLKALVRARCAEYGSKLALERSGVR